LSRQSKLERKQAELQRVLKLIEEQERYSSLKAQGMFGAETKFVDVDKLYRRIDRLEAEIANLQVVTNV